MKMSALRSWEFFLFLLLIAEILFFGSINPRFLNYRILLNSSSDFIYIAILALPFLLIVVLGDIDLSFAFLIGLLAVLFGVLFAWGVPIIIAALLVLVAGTLLSLINAVLINKTKVNALVITLGTGFLFSGSAVVLSGMAGADGYDGIAGFPLSFINIANTNFLNAPIPLYIYIVIAIFFFFLVHRTQIGRKIMLVGQNKPAALYSGISEKNMRNLVFAFIGFFSAVSAILMVSYFGSARSDFGNDYLMPVITAVVLGGANIYGGHGRVLGTILAAFIIGYLQQGLQIIGVPTQLSSAFTGGLLVVIVAVRGGGSIFLEKWKSWIAAKKIKKITDT